jgi:DnaJ family protein A protein 5
VRKRDPRYKAFLAHQAERSQSQTLGSATPVGGGSRKRPQVVEEYVEQDWQRADTSHMHAETDWATAEGDDPEEWECVACRKSFRSEAAWDSHERSKKHMKEVERLRREMLEQNEDFGLNGAEEEEKEEGEGEEEEEEEEMEQQTGVFDVLDPLLPTPPPAAVSVTTADGPSIPPTDSLGASTELSEGAQKSNMKSSRTPTKPKSQPKTQRNGMSVSEFEKPRTKDGGLSKDLSDVPTIPLGEGALAGNTPDPAGSAIHDGSMLGDINDVSQPTAGDSAIGTIAELTKREKRRARQAKKVEAGQTPSNEVT